MTPRERRENIERVLIGPYGVQAAQSKGRLRSEPPCDMRTCFQRDVDRITHSKAFRRLKHKTQVFLQPEGDHYRTRLTHTLEVSRIARTIARSLELNEDLCEAIALGHDLGHTPFGHAGERALAAISPLGFKHSEQSLRVADCVENDGLGLNLCHETRMGILSHSDGEGEENLEAKAVRLADRIAYINHDIDDAVRAGIVRLCDLPAPVLERLGESHSLRINTILSDIVQHSAPGAIDMSREMAETVELFHDFMYEAVYLNPVAKGEESKVAGILSGIWNYYIQNPLKLPEEFLKIAERDGLERAVCDYVSGMTDKYAMYQYSTLFIPAAWVVR